MSSILSAIGIATPSFCFSQDQILRFMVDAHQLNSNDASRLEKLYTVSGISQRHSVLSDFGEGSKYELFDNSGSDTFPTTAQRGAVYEKEAIGLCLKAVDQLKEKVADLNLQDITHLITVSCTGMYAPGLDIDLIEKLNLNKSTERTCINFMGCYGAFNALKVADYICRARKDAKVLIVAVELCTLHFQKESTLENWVANSLFADGATAILVEPEENASTEKGFLLKSFYTELALEARDEMAWHIGDTGYEMRLSSRIAKNIKSKIKSVTDKLLKAADLKLSDISGMAVHPGGRRILEVCDEEFENSFCLKHSFEILKMYGNMSSVTILFVLQRFLEETKPGANLMSFAFGPGLTIESMILQTV
ncbi:MAG TPA: type III polyketide synthase [Sphingobacteriaceae bacterium]|nr:type III polyketide synthase [Sphingobacteriaceae bacterium]